MKAILSVTFILFCWTSLSQTPSTASVDSLVNLIDKDTSLNSKTISLDTLHSTDGRLVKTEVTFVAYTDPSTNQVHKIVWNIEGDYYSFVTIWYNKGFAIKGIVKAKYTRTDTNPEYETHTVFYFQKNEVVKDMELNGNDRRANGFWYLSTINYFIALAGLKTK